MVTRRNRGAKSNSPYYRLDRILKENSPYNVIFGERSNGKTYAALEYGLKKYFDSGEVEQMALIRREKEDFQQKRAFTMFDALVSNGVIKELSGGRYENVYYWSGRWYMCHYDDNGNRVNAPTPFCYAFAISSMEHDKSTSYPNVSTVVFDEFMTRKAYLVDEFVLFMNVLSTIIRRRDNVKIFMLANTVNKYCPYFTEMGLHHAKYMKAGDIDVYTYGDSKLKVAVEFADKGDIDGKPSDFYFAFNNPKLSMITGNGKTWEIAIYPHKPFKFYPKEILFMFFIEFDNEMLQCEVVNRDTMVFLFIHRKTGEIKHPEKDLLYSPEYSPLPNRSRNIMKPRNNIEKKICDLFRNDKVFYQDNEVGEVVRNYLKWCGK